MDMTKARESVRFAPWHQAPMLRMQKIAMLSMESTVTFHDESTTAVWYRSSCACATSNQKDPPLSEQPRLIDEIKKLGHRALLFAALSDEKDLAF
jgi:hypothetical protein